MWPGFALAYFSIVRDASIPPLRVRTLALGGGGAIDLPLMNPRWIQAGLVAAVVLFSWSFVSHMALGLEEKFITGLPDAAAASLKASIPQSGMYFFPNEKDPEKMAALTQTNPYGIVAIAVGKPFSFPASLGRQFGIYLVCGLIAAWLYAKALPSLRSVVEQVAFVALIGVLSALLITGGYANWYNFPWGLVAVGMLDQGIGWGLVGLVFSKMIR
jgi:hypothetical protein